MEILRMGLMYFLVFLILVLLMAVFEAASQAERYCLNPSERGGSISNPFPGMVAIALGVAISIYMVVGIITILTTKTTEAKVVWEVAVRFILSGLLFLLAGKILDHGKWYVELEQTVSGIYLSGVFLIACGVLVGLAVTIREF